MSAPEFTDISPVKIKDNVFTLIGSDWMLVTAGKKNSFNTMTASWGGFGVLWGKNIAWCVIRPTRYTYEFTEKNELFTFSFFSEKYRDALSFCGKVSGRDTDKMAKAGLTPFEIEKEAVSFHEARLVIVLKKIYFHDLDPNKFLEPSLDNNYPKKDYHRMYIGEIIKCAAKGG